MKKMIVLGVALVLSFVLLSVSEAVNLKKAIIGKWVELGEDGSWRGEVEFLKDGTVILITLGSFTARESNVGSYKFIDDNRLKIEFSGHAMVAEVSIDKQGQLILIDPAGKIETYITKAEWEKRVAAAKAEQAKKIEAAKKAKVKAMMEKLKKEGIQGMVFVKGGCFQMGDTFGDGGSDEKPVHEVCVDDFYMGKYEVTQLQWDAIMGNNPSHFKGCDNCPVEQVSWNDTQEFINELNQKTGKKYRLPTEAEWEYAARSGGKNEKYSGGNALDSVAWYNSNSTHPVGQKQPNGLGIYDMSGNVCEWVQDWYDEDYYKNSPKDNPKGANSGQYRMLRGGSWGHGPWSTEAAARSWFGPAERLGNFGFRLSVLAQ